MNSFLLSIRPYRSLLLALLFMGSLVECKCIRSLFKPKADSTQVSSSANVVLNQNLTDQEIKDRIRKNANIPADSIRIKRCPCDPKLINIALPNDWQFEGQEGEVAIKPKERGQNGGGDVDLGGAIAINQRVSPLDESQFLTGGTIEDSIKRDSVDAKFLFPVENAGGTDADAVSIAVFDSGLNPNYVRNTSWERSTTLCTGNQTESRRGWNFMNSPVTPLTADDQQVKHGSRVAYLLARQFTGSTIPYRIVPMKVLGKDNTGDLFGILCAMETARQNGIQIFNMSLGYYGDRDTVFAQYIKRAVDQGIWIVTAAGNQPDTTEERDLSKRKKSFYPAFFSKDFERVIAVTTVQNSKVCDGQNFDGNFALGVKDDVDCRFRLLQPGTPKNIGVIGTSYAAPILAGWLAQNLKQPKLSNPATKRDAFTGVMQTSSTAGLFQGLFVTRK